MRHIQKLDEMGPQDTQNGRPILGAHDLIDTEKISVDLSNVGRAWDLEVLKLLAENMPIIVSAHRGSRIIYANSTLSKILGYTQEEMLEKTFWDVVHPDHREMVKARGLARLRGEEVPANYEFKVLKKNGEVIWLNLFFAVTNLDGENICISASIDITESKRLKEELQAARDELEVRVKQRTEELKHRNRELSFINQNLSNVLHNMSDGVATVKSSGDFEILNPFLKPISDKLHAEIKSKLKELFISGKVPFINRMMDELKSFKDREIKLHLSDGLLRLLATGTYILDEQGIASRGVIIVRPINEVHRLVNQLIGAQAVFHFDDIITGDNITLEQIGKAKRAAANMSNVLITGESGTGKEMFAQAIHNESPVSKGPFIAVNCGAIPRELISSELFGYDEGAFTGARKGGKPGKFELATGGTIFLDEIGDMPFEQQSTLLRVIEEKTITRIGGTDVIKVDARIICATNKDLWVEMSKGNFRQDLYYRLNVINIKIPPLRERPNDIILLFRYFLKEAEPRFNISAKEIRNDLFEYLLKYQWPGNVRELQNVIERMLNNMSGPVPEIEHFPLEIRKASAPQPTGLPNASKNHSGLTIKDARILRRQMKAESEKAEIIRLLDEHGGNVSRVAEALGISRTTLYKKMQHFLI